MNTIDAQPIQVIERKEKDALSSTLPHACKTKI
jgi:hypothetical protein